MLPIRKYGSPRARYRCRTVQAEHPRSRATSWMVSTSPKASAARFSATGFATGSSARGESAKSPCNCSASLISPNLTCVILTVLFLCSPPLPSIAVFLSLQCPVDCFLEPIREHAPEEPESCEQQSDNDQSVLHRSEEHTSELQSLRHLVCRLLLEKK